MTRQTNPSDAEMRGTYCREWVARALAWCRARTLKRLAAKGYRFYAAEAIEFAEASQPAVAEVWAHGD